jgi:predicted nucleic acid-binding protein
VVCPLLRTQIAAIALANNMPLVTRNMDDFKTIPNLALVDPWNAS